MDDMPPRLPETERHHKKDPFDGLADEAHRLFYAAKGGSKLKHDPSVHQMILALSAAARSRDAGFLRRSPLFAAVIDAFLSQRDHEAAEAAKSRELHPEG